MAKFFEVIGFILIANTVGTQVFLPKYVNLSFVFEIWTWSMLANLVFITTMSASILIPSKLHNRGGDILECGILCCVMVYIGYILSWYTVCNFSDEWNMNHFGWVYFGFWGSLASMLTFMHIMNSKPKKEFGECRE
ncbi:MAG: hypothetical protein ACPH5Y_07410 [Candidatus Poseidoniaceae archaeon]